MNDHIRSQLDYLIVRAKICLCICEFVLNIIFLCQGNPLENHYTILNFSAIAIKLLEEK